ncbi:hypothetical protein ACFW9U_10305 [Rhodococcus aetherivorans]|uniref:hypothetical protein n=1 Tax=Rhodococcus aetherivorans TaxID=191292 RepID=UPI00366FBA0E
MIGIRSTVGRQAREAGDRLRGRKSATVHAPPARAHATGIGQFGASTIVAGESDVDRLGREVKQQGERIAELDRKLTEADVRARYALEDRLDELNREIEKKAQRNAELMWWGVVLIGAGIAAQTVGSLL